MDSMYEQEQLVAGIDELKLHMLKTLIIAEASLSDQEKTFVEQSLPEGFESLEKLIKDGLVEPLNNAQKKIAEQITSEKQPRFW